MRIEVRRFGPGRPIILMIDGEPYDTRAAAEKLGLRVEALRKRLERGTDLVRPVAKGNAAWQSLGA